MEANHNYTFQMSGKKYADGWDRIFGKKKKKKVPKRKKAWHTTTRNTN